MQCESCKLISDSARIKVLNELNDFIRDEFESLRNDLEYLLESDYKHTQKIIPVFARIKQKIEELKGD